MHGEGVVLLGLVTILTGDLWLLAGDAGDQGTRMEGVGYWEEEEEGRTTRFSWKADTGDMLCLSRSALASDCAAAQRMPAGCGRMRGQRRVQSAVCRVQTIPSEVGYVIVSVSVRARTR